MAADIDELKSTALAEAVALKQGMSPLSSGWWWNPAAKRAVFIGEKYPTPMERPENHYRPDRNIAQAWELDGDGWLWHFTELKAGKTMGRVLFVTLWPDTGERECLRSDMLAIAKVKLADFPTKENAYATIRCRAFLKAMETIEAQHEDQR